MSAFIIAALFNLYWIIVYPEMVVNNFWWRKPRPAAAFWWLYNLCAIGCLLVWAFPHHK